MKKNNIVYILVFLLNLFYVIANIKYGFGILNSREKIYISANNLSGHNANIKSKAFDMLIEDYKKSISIDNFFIRINIFVTLITILGITVMLILNNNNAKQTLENKK
jgi:hypothetical protein